MKRRGAFQTTQIINKVRFLSKRALFVLLEELLVIERLLMCRNARSAYWRSRKGKETKMRKADNIYERDEIIKAKAVAYTKPHCLGGAALPCRVKRSTPCRKPGPSAEPSVGQRSTWLQA